MCYPLKVDKTQEHSLREHLLQVVTPNAQQPVQLAVDDLLRLSTSYALSNRVSGPELNVLGYGVSI